MRTRQTEPFSRFRVSIPTPAALSHPPLTSHLSYDIGVTFKVCNAVVQIFNFSNFSETENYTLSKLICIPAIMTVKISNN
jgi:hypothetical protein